MENGMDSSMDPSLESKHFIVDSSTEAMNSCFDFESSATFSNVERDNSSSIKGIPFVEDDFRNRNNHALVDRRKVSQLLNGNETSSNDESDLRPISQKADSSQEFVNSQNSVNNLKDNISIMNINANTQESLKCPDFVDVHHFDFSGDSSSLTIGCKAETVEANDAEIMYISYESENQMPDIMKLIQKDLSEPYSIYTYRYFIHNWPHLCFLAVSKGKSVGAIVCKLDLHRKIIKRGYIAMLAVDESYRKKGIGSNLVLKAIRVMATEGADEVVLETEITNQPALRLYENLGFVRDKRLFRYYLNGVDALRLKLWLR